MGLDLRWTVGAAAAAVVLAVAANGHTQVANFWQAAQAFAAIQQEKTDTSVMAYHFPIYPRFGETVVYGATATPPAGLGIRKIRVTAIAYEVSESGGRLSYRGPILDTGLECQWNTPPYPTTPQVCALDPIDLPANSYVWYSATLTLSDNSVRKDRRIRHAAKLSQDVIDAYDGAIPVYRRGTHTKKFDVLFTRDLDYLRSQDFIDDMGRFVWSGYFGIGPLHAYRRYFNVYMNDFAYNVNIENPDGDGCSDHTIYADPDEAPDNFDDISWADIHVFAHLTTFQDCAHIRLGGGAKASADTGTNLVTVSHESLHALAGMDDEYRTSDADEATSDAVGPHYNTFTSDEACYDHGAGLVEHAYDYWWNSSQCRTLSADSLLYSWDSDFDIMTSSGVLSFEEIAQLETLIDDQNLSAFSKTPDLAIRQTSRELSKEVYKEAQQSIADDMLEAQTERQSRALQLKLLFGDRGVALKDSRIVTGTAPNLFLPEHPSDYLVSLLDAQGNVVTRFYTPDPRRSCDGELPMLERPGKIEATAFDFKVTWDPHITQVQVEDRDHRVLLRTPLKSQPRAMPAARPPNVR